MKTIKERRIEKCLPGSPVSYQIKDIEAVYDDNNELLERNTDNTRFYEPRLFLKDWGNLHPTVKTFTEN